VGSGKCVWRRERREEGARSMHTEEKTNAEFTSFSFSVGFRIQIPRLDRARTIHRIDLCTHAHSTTVKVMMNDDCYISGVYTVLAATGTR
jgi:hypothetical protein